MVNSKLGRNIRKSSIRDKGSEAKVQRSYNRSRKLKYSSLKCQVYVKTLSFASGMKREAV